MRRGLHGNKNDMVLVNVVNRPKWKNTQKHVSQISDINLCIEVMCACASGKPEKIMVVAEGQTCRCSTILGRNMLKSCDNRSQNQSLRFLLLINGGVLNP